MEQIIIPGLCHTGSLTSPGSALALLLHNNRPDEHEIFDLDQFTRSPDLGFILLGKWQTKPDAYHLYHALYAVDKNELDSTSIKQILCNKVQTIVIHMEGAEKHLAQLLKTMDFATLNKLLVYKVHP